MGAKKKIYNEGDVIGNMVYLNEEEPKLYTYGNLQRQARFRCECGGEIVTCIISVKSGGTKSCGCKAHGKYNGASKHPLFPTWAGMITRCFNPNHKSFSRYGGRGITVCSEWINDPQAYIDYIISLENFGVDGYDTIDRIKNDGNYESNNLQWATQSMQMQNTMVPKSSTGYVGVYPKKKRFRAVVYNNNVRFNLPGSFITALEAVTARDQYIIDNNLNQPLQVLQITV